MRQQVLTVVRIALAVAVAGVAAPALATARNGAPVAPGATVAGTTVTLLASSPGGTTRLPEGAGRGLRRIDAGRDALLNGSLADAVQAAAAIANVPVTPLPVAPAAAPGVPAGLAAPVAALLDAGRASAAAARTAVSLRDSDVAQLHGEILAVLDAAATAHAPPAGTRSRDATERSAVLQRRIDAGVDRARLYSAAFTLAGAIDAALPALRAAATPPHGTAVEGCDVVDRAPVLCVAGTGANTIRTDYSLVIDLGGDDLHLHSAGGASPTANGNGMAVAVTIDVAGNDRYEATAGDQFDASQGVGRTGGLGVLVDVAGDDVYQTTARRQGEAFSDLINAQGTATAGVGMLADLAGTDRYTVANAVGGGSGNGASGLGSAVLGGLALALDRGAGADTATVAGTPGPEVTKNGVRPTMTRAGGFGYSAGAAVAVFADDGGSDSLTLRAAPPVPAGAVATLQPSNSIVHGFGYGGLGSAGLSLTGPGSQTSAAEAKVSSPAPAGVASGAFGWTALGGIAASVDAGGDDHYRIDLTSSSVADVRVDDACACADQDFTFQSGMASVGGMGNAVLGGVVGVHADLGGNDRYHVSARSTSNVSAEDLRSPEGRQTALQVSASAGPAAALAQGTGITGAGLLVDAGGADTYVSDIRSTATVTGSAVTRDNIVSAASGTAAGDVQGSGWGDFGGAAPGLGALLDSGGIDSYSATAALDSRVGDSATTEAGTGLAHGAARANGAGILVDLDGAASDRFASFPLVPACTGTRGQGVWRDCGEALGAGVNS